MQIPVTITLQVHAISSGENGYSLFDLDDQQGLGIMLQSKRRGSIHPYAETWSLRALPHQCFSSLADLRQAAAALTEQDIAAEAGKYPAMRPVMRDTIGNRCRLCSPKGLTPTGNHTYRVVVATCWSNARDVITSLCADHTAEYHDHPAALLQALDAELAARTSKSSMLDMMMGGA